MAKECLILKKLKNGEKFSKDDVKIIMNIVRQEMNYMIKHNILMTPNNYERWFNVFCYITESKKEFNDLEILGLFKEFYEVPYDEIKEQIDKEPETPKGFIKKLNQIAETIDKKLLDIIHATDKHNDSLNNHSDYLAKNQENITSENLNESVAKILKEIKKLQEENRELTSELKKYHEDVQKLQEELRTARKDAETDFLTGLVNRKRFERALLDLLDDLKKRKYPFSLIMLDIDDFKKINDTYGHQAGDAVLQEVSFILKNFLRANAIPARIGGEEFAVILPGATIEEAEKIGERLRKAIENRSFHIDDLNVTASFGVTEAKEDDDLNSIYERVDKAMYEAKKSGKNRVVVV